MAGRPSKDWHVFVVAALLSLALTPQLWQAGQLGFYSDDYVQLVRFRYLDSLGQTAGNLRHYLLSDEPFFHLYHALRYYVLGGNPAFHHFFIGMMAAANAVAAFGLVYRLSRRRLLSYLFLLLFLCYPLRSQAYLWPAAVYVPLLLCLLTALHLWLTWLQTGRRWAYAAAVGTYGIAVFTHETAFAFLVVFAALWWWPGWNVTKQPGTKAWGPLLLVNAAYFAMRQTHWLGSGDPGLQPFRHLSAHFVIPNLLHTLRVNFGAPFLVSIEHTMREATALQSMSPPAAALFAALLALGLIYGTRSRTPWTFLEGVLLAGVAIGSLALYSDQTPVPDLFVLLVLALRVVVVMGLAAVIKARLLPTAADREIILLFAFGGLWFFAGYAPTWVLHVASRHQYIPSVGLCLMMAVALWWPLEWLVGRPRHALEGAVITLTALLCIGFHAAVIGETERWIAAARLTERLKQQIREAVPSLKADSKVVILGLPDEWNGVPLLPGYAIQGALRHWYNHTDLLASEQFVPRGSDFLFYPSGAGHPYERLLLFTLNGDVLTRVWLLSLSNGTEISLGKPADKNGARSGSTEVTRIRVALGQVVRQGAVLD